MAARPRLSPAPAAEACWVEGELVRALMATQRSTRWFGPLLMPVFVALLWASAPHGALLLWAAATAGVHAVRFAMLHAYARHVAYRGGAEHLAFLRRWWPVWPASAASWGVTVPLFYDRAPLPEQFACWLVLAVLGMIAINTVSSQLTLLRRYLDTLAIAALAGVAVRIAVAPGHLAPSYHWWLALLVVLFWHVLRQAGLRQHVTLRKSYELQYRNSQLIDSLTRQTQAALDAVEIKNRFLASAAHDLRQPVHALALYADWLAGEPELAHEIAPKIVQSTKAVNALFDSLFDLVRLDAGKIRLKVEQLRLDKLLHDLELHYRPLAEAKGLQFRVRAGAGSVVSDPILLQRVVGNLISNAIKYTHRGGVLVAARQRGGAPCIEIWDTGVGIAPMHQREIFREFYKVPGHAGTEEGFGLGLYIVRRLSAILGHPVQLSSRPGRGTVFRLVVHPTDAGEAAERARASIDLQKEREQALAGAEGR